MKRYLSSVVLFLCFAPWLIAQISFTPSSLTWSSNDTGSKAITVHSSGEWNTDSLYLSSHFAVSRYNGPDGCEIYIYPKSINTGSTAIVEDVPFWVSGSPGTYCLHLVHSAVSDTLSVSPSSLYWDHAATNGRTVNITCTSSWTAHTTENWIGISASSGNGNGSITITPVSPNNLSVDRTAMLVISSGSLQETVSLCQGCNMAITDLTVSPSVLSWEAEQVDTRYVTIVSDGRWYTDTTTNYLTGFTMSQYSGSTNAVVGIAPSDRNRTDYDTERDVTIWDDGGNHTVLSLRQGSWKNSFSVSPSSLVWDADSTSAKTLSINCPSGWYALVKGYGFSVTPLGGQGSSTVTVMPTGYNPAGSARAAILEIHGDGTTLARTVTLRQNAAGSTVTEMEDVIESADYSPGINIPYTRGVSPSGAMTYTVPIMTASGLKYVPQLGLAYNSQSGNGLAGYGWSLAGISAIEVTNRTPYYDGVRAAADADSPDAAYSLDGVRLVQNENGAMPDWQYKTASGHVIVKKHTDIQGRTLWFEALYPDGTSAIFGESTSVVPSVSYPLTESHDRNGHWIRYIYSGDEQTYDIHPVRVEYGAAGSATALASIYLEYVTRTDWHKRYLSGRGIGHSVLLKRIVSLNGADTLGTYNLVHELRNEVNLLRRVESADAVPLRFGYGDSGPVSPLTIHAGVHGRISSDAFVNGTPTFIRGKFVPGRYTDGVIAVSRPDSTGRQPICVVASLDPDMSDSLGKFTLNKEADEIQAADLDGDGTDEIVTILRAHHVAAAFIHGFDSDGSSHSLGYSAFDFGMNNYGSHYTYRWGDFLGNGKSTVMVIAYRRFSLDDWYDCKGFLLDLVNGEIIGSTVSLFPDSVMNMDRVISADIDGDGVTELCLVAENGLELWNASSSGIFTKRCTLAGFTLSSLSGNSKLMITDLNADGYTDMVVSPSSNYNTTWHVYYYNGRSFTHGSWTGPSGGDASEKMFMDLDRDGLPDLVSVSSGMMLVWPNVEGIIVNSSITITNPSIVPSGLVPCNVTRYGASSTLMMLDQAFVRALTFSPLTAEQRHLRRFSDNIGSAYDTRYGYSAELSGYDPMPSYSPDSSSGYIKMSFPGYVVTMDTGNMTERQYYSYAGAVFNTCGLGFCGFREAKRQESWETDASLYIKTVSDPEKRGVPVRTVTYVQHGSTVDTLSRAQYSFDSHSTPYGKQNPRLVQSIETDCLRGIVDTTTVSGYDCYDFPNSIINNKNVVGSGGPGITKTITRTYDHSDSTGLYVLGTVVGEMVSTDMDGLLQNDWITNKEVTLDSLKHPSNIKEDILWRRRVNYGWNWTYMLMTKPLRDTHYTYDSFGNILSESMSIYGADSLNTSTYSYDAQGRHLASSTDPLGRTTTYSGYDRFGNPATTTNRLGQSTVSTYDAWGNLTRRVHPDGTVESETRRWSASEEPGLYCITKTATGQPDTRTWHDALGREVRSANKRFDGSWQFVTTEYDARGRIYRTSLPYKDTVTGPTLWSTYAYDVYGRPVRLTEATGRQTTWSYSGTSTTTTKEGIASTTTTDAAGNVVSVSDPGGTITYTLRDDGQPSSVTVNPSGTNQQIVTSFAYDHYGRRTSISDPSAGTRTDAYTDNADGTSSVAHGGPNGTVTTYYDRYGRVTSVTRPEFNTTYTYGTVLNSSGYGKVLGEVSTNGTGRTFTYDSLGRAATVTEYADSIHTLNKTYTYGAGGNVASIAYATQDGPVTTESYTYANGHNTGISSSVGGTNNAPLNVFTLTAENALGMPTAVTTGTVTRNYAYTGAGLPSSRTITRSGGVTVQSFGYSYDAWKGNLDGRSDNIIPSPEGNIQTSESFTYDGLNRLCRAEMNVTAPPPVDPSDSVQIYYPFIYDAIPVTYDSPGNVLSKGHVSATYGNQGDPYDVNSAEWSDGYGSSEAYAPRIQMDMTSFDRPAAVTDTTSVWGEPFVYASYEYSASGEKARSWLPAAGINRYYMGGSFESEVRTWGDPDPFFGGYYGSETVQRLFLGGDAYSAPMVLVRVNDGAWTAYNIGRDVQGSITHVMTADGELLERYIYDPWGNVEMADSTGIAVDTICVSNIWGGAGMYSRYVGCHGYTGHEYIPGAGLINANARLYDPILGRFISPDPLIQDPASTQNFNRYAYCLNNPLKYTDESGEFWNYVIAGLAGGLTNWLANGHEFTWEGLGYFGIGALVGVLSSGASIWVANSAQACGVFAGALAGAATGSIISGGATTITNGFNNLMKGNNFFDNWWENTRSSFISGAVSGAISGGIEGGKRAFASEKNVWWGSRVKYGRTKWSFFTSEKPYYERCFDVPDISRRMKDCVPASLTESDIYFNSIDRYDEFIKLSHYVDGKGSTISAKEYEGLLSLTGTTRKMGLVGIVDPNHVNDYLGDDSILSLFIPNYVNGEGHADVIRRILYYYDKGVVVQMRIGLINYQALSDLQPFLFIINPL